MIGALLVLLAAGAPLVPGTDSSVAELASEAFQVPAHDYRFLPFRTANWPAALYCEMNVSRGVPVRLEVVPDAELGKFARGKHYSILVAMAAKRRADVRQSLPDKGGYDILLINDGNEPSDVTVEARLQFAREPDVAKYLSPERRLLVIVLSLAWFVATISWSAWKLVGAMKKA